MKRVLLIDNYDSFTYNLYQYLGELAETVEVVRNDAIPFAKLRVHKYTHVVISPGPGNPTDPAYFHGCSQVITDFYDRLPILGICLGHQGIGAAFGAKVVPASAVMHGKTTVIKHTGQGLFHGLDDALLVMRYHSLVLEPGSLPPEILVDATAADGTIMAIRHQSAPLYGLQFHPESFATEQGQTLLAHFLDV